MTAVLAKLPRSLPPLVLLTLLLSAATPAAQAIPSPPADPDRPDPAAARLETPFTATPEIEAFGRVLAHRAGGVKDKADAIVHYIFDEPDGLGFHYRPYPTLTAAEAFADRRGNCLSLVNLFIAVARATGLEAFPVEVEDFESFSRHGGAVVRRTHVIGGLIIPGETTGRLWTIDFLPGSTKAYRRIERIADERHAALYHNAVAAEAMFDGRVEESESHFQTALALDAGAAEVWNNWAVLAKRQGDRPLARRRFEKALDLDPRFLPALNNLASLERASGHPARASELEGRALEQRHQSPYFLIEQSLREMGVGELDAAERLLQRARRIDPSIPEIHLVLGRIELARGHGERAEAYFADARRRAEEETEAFQRGLDRKIGMLVRLAAN